jgi:hypothetical protein
MQSLVTIDRQATEIRAVKNLPFAASIVKSKKNGRIINSSIMLSLRRYCLPVTEFMLGRLTDTLVAERVCESV